MMWFDDELTYRWFSMACRNWLHLCKDFTTIFDGELQLGYNESTCDQYATGISTHDCGKIDRIFEEQSIKTKKTFIRLQSQSMVSMLCFETFRCTVVLLLSGVVFR